MILVATWQDGLFIVRETVTQEFRNQSVRALAPDGSGGALAIVNGRALHRRDLDGVWSAIVRTQLDLACRAESAVAWNKRREPRSAFATRLQRIRDSHHQVVERACWWPHEGSLGSCDVRPGVRPSIGCREGDGVNYKNVDECSRRLKSQA
mgnify:FL=1